MVQLSSRKTIHNLLIQAPRLPTIPDFADVINPRIASSICLLPPLLQISLQLRGQLLQGRGERNRQGVHSGHSAAQTCFLGLPNHSAKEIFLNIQPELLNRAGPARLLPRMPGDRVEALSVDAANTGVIDGVERDP